MSKKDYVWFPAGFFLSALLTTPLAYLCINLYYGRKAEQTILETEKIRVEKGYLLCREDLNQNGIPEEFYEINGERVFLSIDGKPLDKSLESLFKDD